MRTLLLEHPDWLPKLAGLILRNNFPATLHPDIAKQLGLEISAEPDPPEENQEPEAPAIAGTGHAAGLTQTLPLFDDLETATRAATGAPG